MHWWSLGEAANETIAADTGASPSPAPLTLTGGAAFLGPNGEGGGAALSNPNGNDGRFLDFGTGFAFAAIEGVTFAAFVRHNSFQHSGCILHLNDGTSNYIQLRSPGTTRRANWDIKNGGTYKPFSTPAYEEDDEDDDSLAFFPPAGRWAHVAAVATAADPSIFTLYRDAETQDGWTKSDGRPPNPSAVAYTQAALGRSDFSSDCYFDGALRDVRLYTHALAADEVAALARATAVTVTAAPTATTSVEQS